MKVRENLAGLFNPKMNRLRATPKLAGNGAAARGRAERTRIGAEDGRSARKTGRTEQFACRITAETKADIYVLAGRHGWTVGETVERMLVALERQLGGDTERSP